MDYKLALELKEAGFLQKVDVTPIFEVHGTEEIKYPRLAELVAACGTPFMLQTHDGVHWQAFNDTHTISMNENGDGLTPEEAVAKLWLALHKK